MFKDTYFINKFGSTISMYLQNTATGVTICIEKLADLDKHCWYTEQQTLGL